MQAEFTIDLGESAISGDSYIEVFLNERSIGRFSVIKRLAGSQVSLQFNVPGAALKNQNVLRIVWSNGDENHVADGIGWILSSSKFYLPRDYSSELPDLALLQHHLFPLSLKPDLSDTVVVVPDTPSQETLAALFELAANLGRLAPSDRVAFNVRRNGELTPEMKSGAHMILLNLGRTIGNEIDSFDDPVIQQVVSPWNSTRYVLRIAPGKSGTLQTVVHTLFTDGILDRLQGDTVYLTPSGPAVFMLNSRRTVGEYSYLMHIETWMQLNWLALPVILAVASGILFMGVRLALNHYKASAPEYRAR
jgi:Bacterial cellulose synthase subunit